jgi:serine phosphatase RsbU (regulator of sigma subunit)
LTCVITRNNPAPVILVRGDQIEVIDEPVEAVGVRRAVRPSIHEVPLEDGLMVIVYTDGLIHAGDRQGTRMDIRHEVELLAGGESRDPGEWADQLLNRALELDDFRPADDISVLVAATLPNSPDKIRRLWARMPL